MNIMNKRTISSINFSRIPAELLICQKAVATVTATGKMTAVPSLAIPDAPPAGNSPGISFHTRDMSRNKTMINWG